MGAGSVTFTGALTTTTGRCTAFGGTGTGTGSASAVTATGGTGSSKLDADVTATLR